VRTIRFRQVACGARIYLADEFLSPNEIAAALTLAEEAEAFAPKRDETGLSFEAPTERWPVTRALAARLEAAFGFRNAHGGTFRFRHYEAGERHPPHIDAYEIAGSHLVATAMMWLQAPLRGGETRFPDAGLGPVLLEPRAGRLAVWLNYLPDGPKDEAARHEGLTVEAGAKTTLTSFVYGDTGAIPAFARRLEPQAGIDGVRIAAVVG
jgi:hypothetical protein